MGQPPDRAQEAAPGLDPAELRVWMERYGPGLRRYFAKRAPPGEAEDLVQDVFLAMHARNAADPIDNVQGYLFRIAANLLAKRRELGHAGLDDLQDLRGAQVPPETQVAQVMRPQVYSIRPEAPALEAMQRMSRNGYTRLIVVDGTGRMVGTITNADLMRAIEMRTMGLNWGVEEGDAGAPRPVVNGEAVAGPAPRVV